jgi:multiple sugar transport system substrate-binding protein
MYGQETSQEGAQKMAYLRRRIRAAIAVSLVALVTVLSGCSDGSAAGGAKVITFAYSTTYVFGSTALAKAYVNSIKQQYEKKYPGYTVKLIPIDGANNEIVTKLSLMYRSPSTAPDVAEIPTGMLGELVSSNQVLSIDKYVDGASWWAHFPASVQKETIFNGHVYGVNEGMNNAALWYNKALLRKAGIALPWQPRSWADILTAAEAIARTSPNVYPLWLMAGNGSEIVGALLGGLNLVLGSSTPYIQNPTGKFVVDSPGLRQVFGFYKTVAEKHLDAPLSQLVNPNALTFPEALLAKNQVGIEIAGNYVGDEFAPAKVGPGLGNSTCSPCIPNAQQKIGVTAIPRMTGGGAMSTLSGWDLPVYAGAKDPKAVFNLLDMIESKQNMLSADNAAGWPPNDSRYISAPLYDNFSPGFNAFFGRLLAQSTIVPATPAANVWATGFNNATEALLQNPSMSVSAAIGILQQYVTSQLGSSKTVVVP